MINVSLFKKKQKPLQWTRIWEWQYLRKPHQKLALSKIVLHCTVSYQLLSQIINEWLLCAFMYFPQGGIAFENQESEQKKPSFILSWWGFDWQAEKSIAVHFGSEVNTLTVFLSLLPADVMCFYVVENVEIYKLRTDRKSSAGLF